MAGEIIGSSSAPTMVGRASPARVRARAASTSARRATLQTTPSAMIPWRLRWSTATASESASMSAIITEIENVSGEANIRIADLKPQKVRKTGSFNNFSVSLILDGQLTSIMNFVYNLQNQPHLFAVDEMRFDKKSPNSTDLKGYLILSRVLIQP